MLSKDGGGGFGAAVRILDDEVRIAQAGASQSRKSTGDPLQRITSDMAGIGAAAQLYFLDEGHWPRSLSELMGEGRFPVPDVDPWGNQYLLQSSSTRFTILCLGADGSEGGDGINADIVSQH